MCIAVMNTAARNHDADLATDVLRVLANREAKLDMHHYEALLEAYVGSGDLKTALRILCIMKKAKVEPEEGSTRALVQYMRETAEAPQKANAILHQLHKDGLEIPTAAYNSMLEALIGTDHLFEAVESYKHLHEICPGGPTTATFNALLQGCKSRDGGKDTAMFLASEMAALHIRPDSITYDRLILACLVDDDYEDAFQYLEEMKSQGFLPRGGTYSAMVRRCGEVEDHRAWELVAEMEGEGVGGERMRTWLEKTWGKTSHKLQDGAGTRGWLADEPTI